MSSVRLFVLSLALLPLVAGLCEFSDQAVCDACEGTEVDCNNAIKTHCDSKDWNEAACKAHRVGCPFNDVMRDGELPSSPCALTACVGAIPDHDVCLAAVHSYCAYELVLGNTADAFHTVDAACAQYTPPGCGAGEVLDCSGNCVALTKLNDGTCDANLNCALLTLDGGDCIPPSPSPTPSSSQPEPGCCEAITMQCCSCQQDQSRHGFCRRCRNGGSSASEDCCNTCASDEQETTLSVVLSFPSQPLSTFTQRVRVAMRKSFADMASQEGEFTVNYTDVTLTLTELTRKQGGVQADFTVDLPSEAAAEDALVVLQDEPTVLTRLNQAIADEGETLVLADVTFQNSTSVATEPPPSGGGGSDDDDDGMMLIIVIVVVLAVVVPLLMIGTYCFCKKRSDGFTDDLNDNFDGPVNTKTVASAEAHILPTPAPERKLDQEADYLM